MRMDGDGILAAIHAHVSGIRNEVSLLDANLAAVEGKTDDLRRTLESLAAEFSRFVESDEKQKHLALATTNLVRINQEIEQHFGAYDVVRRTATGILQAVDAHLVHAKTIELAAEKQMLEVPEYWLAAALVALSAWAADDRAPAERALLESLSRDDTKSSLFFALVCRRANRPDSSLRWLDRYFRLQDPFALEPEALVVLDALACGVFGTASHRRSMSGIDDWMEAVRERVGVLETERSRWAEYFRTLMPAPGLDAYAYLKRHSPTWPRLEATVRGARLHGKFLKNLDALFAGPVVSPVLVARRVDALIDRLVTNFDAAERPKQRERRRAEILIEHGGDRAAAAARIAREERAFEQRHSFAALLTNGALGLGAVEMSRGTRRFCYALSAPWIAEAHDDVTAEVRANAPMLVEIAIDGWSGSTRDGADETELLASWDKHMRGEEGKAAGGLMRFTLWWPLVLAALAFAWTIHRGGSRTFFFLGVCLVLVQGLLAAGHRVRLHGVRRRYAEARRAGASIVRACCAEVVDLRELISREDARADEVQARLLALRAAEEAHSASETRRMVLV